MRGGGGETPGPRSPRMRGRAAGGVAPRAEGASWEVFGQRDVWCPNKIDTPKSVKLSEGTCRRLFLVWFIAKLIKTTKTGRRHFLFGLITLIKKMQSDKHWPSDRPSARPSDHPSECPTGAPPSPRHCGFPPHTRPLPHIMDPPPLPAPNPRIMDPLPLPAPSPAPFPPPPALPCPPAFWTQNTGGGEGWEWRREGGGGGSG